MSIRSQKELEIELSHLKDFAHPSAKLEQYSTPSPIAAEWIWSMGMKGEITGKKFLDAACGPGILGLGLLLLGAKKVLFLDKDQAAIDLCTENYLHLKQMYKLGQAEFIVKDIALFEGEVDIVVQNPPFGTKDEHADKRFLEKAFTVAPIIYSMHKASTLKFVEAIAQDFNYRITEEWHFDFPIKASFWFHRKPVKNIDVILFRLEKEK